LREVRKKWERKVEVEVGIRKIKEPNESTRGDCRPSPPGLGSHLAKLSSTTSHLDLTPSSPLKASRFALKERVFRLEKLFVLKVRRFKSKINKFGLKGSRFALREGLFGLEEKLFVLKEKNC